MAVSKHPEPSFMLRNKLIDEASAKYFVGQLTSAILFPGFLQSLCRIICRHDNDHFLIFIHSWETLNVSQNQKFRDFYLQE
jgi:hypothetical protein